jgi:hypothetical protein
MAFEDLKDNTADIKKEAKAYIENSLAYYKLWGFKVAMKSTTMILKFSLIAIALLMVLLFCSIAVAFAIGKSFDNISLGFLIVGCFYLLVTGLLFLVKDKVVEGPILEKFSEIFFND